MLLYSFDGHERCLLVAGLEKIHIDTNQYLLPLTIFCPGRVNGHLFVESQSFYSYETLLFVKYEICPWTSNGLKDTLV